MMGRRGIAAVEAGGVIEPVVSGARSLSVVSESFVSLADCAAAAAFSEAISALTLAMAPSSDDWL